MIDVDDIEGSEAVGDAPRAIHRARTRRTLRFRPGLGGYLAEPSSTADGAKSTPTTFGSQASPGQGVETEVALQVQQGLACYVRRLRQQVELQQRRLACEEPVDAVELRGGMDGD